MSVRKVLASLCIVGMLATGIGIAVFLITQDPVPGPAATPQRPLVPTPEIPTPEEFQVGVQVTAQQCAEPGRCAYTYSIVPTYIGLHPLPEHDFTVFYEVIGGSVPQPGTFTVSRGQARMLKDVVIEGPAGAQLAASVTRVSPIAGPTISAPASR